MKKVSLNILMVLSLTLGGCPKKDTDKESTPVITKNSTEGLLNVSLSKVPGSSSLELNIYNYDKYQGSQFTCLLDNTPLSDCKSVTLITTPNRRGEHIVKVIAMQESQVVAVGETRFTVGDNVYDVQLNSTSTYFDDSSTASNDLELEVDPSTVVYGQPFVNGMAVRQDLDFTVKFKFKQTPGCQVEIRCSSGRADTEFKPLCDSKSHRTFPRGTMPKGFQYLRVQANCINNSVTGKPLEIYWYGVPASYSPMAIEYYLLNSGGKKQYTFNLVKDSDCPSNHLQFQCRESAGRNFTNCSNQVTNPATGFAIRPVCRGVIYPELVLK